MPSRDGGDSKKRGEAPWMTAASHLLITTKLSLLTEHPTQLCRTFREARSAGALHDFPDFQFPRLTMCVARAVEARSPQAQRNHEEQKLDIKLGDDELDNPDSQGALCEAMAAAQVMTDAAASGMHDEEEEEEDDDEDVNLFIVGGAGAKRAKACEAPA